MMTTVGSATPEFTPIQVVAVVFKDLDQRNMTFKRSTEKPYFYLDLFGATVGEHYLVHNGQNFSIVEVMRVITTSDDIAVSRVTKPLLAHVIYDSGKIAPAASLLEEYKTKTEDSRIQRAINEQLDSTRLDSYAARRAKQGKVFLSNNDPAYDVDHDKEG